MSEHPEVLAALEAYKRLPVKPAWGPGVIPPEVWEQMSQAEIDLLVQMFLRDEERLCD